MWLRRWKNMSWFERKEWKWMSWSKKGMDLDAKRWKSWQWGGTVSREALHQLNTHWHASSTTNLFFWCCVSPLWLLPEVQPFWLGVLLGLLFCAVPFCVEVWLYVTWPVTPCHSISVLYCVMICSLIWLFLDHMTYYIMPSIFPFIVILFLSCYISISRIFPF